MGHGEMAEGTDAAAQGGRFLADGCFSERQVSDHGGRRQLERERPIHPLYLGPSDRPAAEGISCQRGFVVRFAVLLGRWQDASLPTDCLPAWSFHLPRRGDREGVSTTAAI